MQRPVLYVLAGVNGAGKSSIGGHVLQEAGLNWFNPDVFARELVCETGCSQPAANAAAWQEGLRRLDDAIATRRNHAFETTLGGKTIAARLHGAAATHDVLMWFCGLATPELHLARVQARVSRGGHDIPEAKIRERFTTSREHLIALMPALAQLQIHDNSADAPAGAPIPDPLLLAQLEGGRLLWPVTVADLKRTPDWAKPLLEAALTLHASGTPLAGESAP